MRIYLNGESIEIPDRASVAELLAQRGLLGQRLAVELNRQLVPRGQFADQRLAPDDRVEIIRAVGGG